MIIKKSISAVIVIHNYGFVTDLNLLQKICNTNGVFLIEDCAEAIGSTFNGIPVGSFGDAATFSFFANKEHNWSCRLKNESNFIKNEAQFSYRLISFTINFKNILFVWEIKNH